MFEPMKALLVPFLIVALLLVVMEAAFSRARKLHLYAGRDAVCNIVILIVGKISQPLFLGYYFATLKMLEGLRLCEIPSNATTTILAVVLTDFVYYWEHRFSHKFHSLWLFHEVHHSSRKFNLSTSFRLSWLGRLTAPIVFAPLIAIGFRADQVLLFFAVNLFYQSVLHTQTVRTLGPLEGIINTPSAHRVHHARNEAYIDKNFGGIFMIWDKLFGTYMPETEVPEFGTLGDFESDNPLAVQFHNLPGYSQLETFFRPKLRSRHGSRLLIIVVMSSLISSFYQQAAIGKSTAIGDTSTTGSGSGSGFGSGSGSGSGSDSDLQHQYLLVPIQSASCESGAPSKQCLIGRAEIVQEREDSSLIGTWKGHIKEYARHPSIIIEEQTGDQIKGTYKGLLGRFPLRGTYSRETGALRLYVDFGGARLLRHTMFKSAVAVMNGTLSGDVITGMANIEDMGRRDVHFEARRSQTK